MNEYVIYHFRRGTPICGVSIYVSNYTDVTGIAALRRFSDSLVREGQTVKELENYLLVIPMRDLELFVKHGLAPFVRVDTAQSIKQVCKHLKFDLQTKVFS